MQVADGIYRIDTRLGSRLSSVYVIAGSRSAILFDVGIHGDAATTIGPYLDSVGVARESLSFILISHCDVDHFGGLHSARVTFPGSRVLAHELDRAAIVDYQSYLRYRAREFLSPYGFDEQPAVLEWARSVTRQGPVDLTVKGGEVFDLGDRDVEILHVPGHTRGHLALRDVRTGALVVSDAVLGAAVRNADGTGAFPPTYRYVQPYLATIERLRGFDAPLLLTAHYPTFTGAGVAEFLDESEGFVSRLDSRIWDAVQRQPGGLTLDQLLADLNDGSEDWPVQGTAGAFAFPVVGHVERLCETGVLMLDQPTSDSSARIGVR